MDFLKILRSFEELIFEATTWLAFYPRTLWRIITRPLAMMEYSDAEQADDEAGRYDDALSPPLVLLITVVLINGLGLALHIPVPPAANPVTKALFSSPQNLALFRALMFSLIPLVAAMSLLRHQGLRLARENLRPPFYAQCYLAAPCAIFVGLGGIILRRPEVPNLAGALLTIAGLVWFLTAETRWFAKKLAIPWPRAAGITVFAVVRATLYLFAVLIPLALL